MVLIDGCDLLPQVLLKASLEYPDTVSIVWEGTGQELLAFYAGGETERLSRRSMPHVMTFQQYWERLLQQGCTQPELAPKVSDSHQKLRPRSCWGWVPS